MVRNGIDFSFGNGLTTAQIQSGGNAFVGRYLSGGSSKDIGPAEWAHYKQAGIAVVCFWETMGIMSSASLGLAHAHAANAQLAAIAHAMGDPSVAGTPVFFTADAQSQPDEPDYLRAAASVVGHGRCGIYGGVGTVRAAFNAGLAAYACQTYAWSGGQWDDRALLRQYRNDVPFGPARVDLEQAAYWGNAARILTLHDDFGQWPKLGAPPPGPPPQQPHDGPPYRVVAPEGNTRSLDGIASDRGTTAEAIISYSLPFVSPEHAAVLTTYLACLQATRGTNVQRPVLPTGTVYYLRNKP